MRAIQFEWDGTHLPKELRQLPTGRYVLSDFATFTGDDDLTPEEEEGIRLALDEAEAGDVIPYEEVMRELRSRVSRT